MKKKQFVATWKDDDGDSMTITIWTDNLEEYLTTFKLGLDVEDFEEVK